VTVNTLANTLIKTLGLSIVSISLLTGCAKEKYQAKPIEPSQISAKLQHKDATSAEFKTYLIKQGFKESDLPFASWGLNELTLCALYFHSKLDVAKAEMALANANLETAGLKQNITLTSNLARTNQANNDIRPWAYGLNVEIPIETSNKRNIRIEEAQHLVEVARLDVADAAWQLRSKIANDLLLYHENLAQMQALSKDLKQKDVIVNLMQKRVALGVLSNTELHTAKLQQQKALFTLNAEQAKTAEIRAILAADVGLTDESFSKLTLKPLDIDTNLTQQDAYLTDPAKSKLREEALLNRLDIRRSLEKYAAAEANIKLEVAKQTPDISLNPGYAFEFGDKVWSLGFSTFLNLLNKHPTLINEATKLREIEGAQFEALQAKIISDLEQNLANYAANSQNLKQVKQYQETQLAFERKVQRQFDAGLVDKLELTQNQLNTTLLEQQLVAAQFSHLKAALTLEEILQRPIFDDFSLITKFSESASTDMVGTSP
jgi:cobalt-zinc-cadmium efflux system outer membrane protein